MQISAILDGNIEWLATDIYWCTRQVAHAVACRHWWPIIKGSRWLMLCVNKLDCAWLVYWNDITSKYITISGFNMSSYPKLKRLTQRIKSILLAISIPTELYPSWCNCHLASCLYMHVRDAHTHTGQCTHTG